MVCCSLHFCGQREQRQCGLQCNEAEKGCVTPTLPTPKFTIAYSLSSAIHVINKIRRFHQWGHLSRHYVWYPFIPLLLVTPGNYILLKNFKSQYLNHNCLFKASHLEESEPKSKRNICPSIGSLEVVVAIFLICHVVLRQPKIWKIVVLWKVEPMM